MASFPNLETNRFILRPLALDDVDAVFSFYSDPQTAWFTGREPYTRGEQAQKKVEQDLAVIAAGEGFIWAITSREAEDDRALGIACLFHWSKPNRNLELGYVLSRAQWGNGVMRECVPPVIRYAFEVLDIHRIDASVDARNTPSIRVLERCGFVREGALRQKTRDAAGGYDDLLCFGLLEQEWRARR